MNIDSRFRFRIWDFDSKRMIKADSVKEFVIKNGNPSYVVTDHVITDVKFVNGYCDGVSQRKEIIDNFFAIMQSTGIFDINCQEMFEADIILFSPNCLKIPCVIRYCQNGLYMNSVDREVDLKPPDVDNINQFSKYSCKNDYQVVGNILENSDLWEEYMENYRRKYGQ